MSSAPAFAKINLALVVGPMREDRKHEVVTLLQRVDLHDDVEVERGEPGRITVEGFEDTIVGRALELLAAASRGSAGWRVRLQKAHPGCGRARRWKLGCRNCAPTCKRARRRAAFARDAARSRSGGGVRRALLPGGGHAARDSGRLDGLTGVASARRVDRARAPEGEHKESTASVYERFDERGGEEGFDGRREALLAALERVRAPLDLAALPRNDLASSPLAAKLEELGAFRADVSGAGPTVYGLFERKEDAERAARALAGSAWTRVARPVHGP